jgi:Mn-dependent DtxR family transcriptional regulator
VDALSLQYGKLIKVTQEKKGSVDVQRVAERLDQQVRVLERTKQILEENRKL